MSVVRASIHIAVAPERVWEVIMDPQRFGDWVTIHRKLLSSDDGELRVGFRVRQRLALAGAPFEVRWRLAELDPPRLGVWEGAGPARSTARIENHLEARDGGTHFEYLNEYRNPGGLLGAMAGRVLVAGLADREANRSLQRLKALLEG
jgi:carbon monoxide dehydrogenase subunit G